MVSGSEITAPAHQRRREEIPAAAVGLSRESAYPLWRGRPRPRLLTLTWRLSPAASRAAARATSIFTNIISQSCHRDQGDRKQRSNHCGKKSAITNISTTCSTTPRSPTREFDQFMIELKKLETEHPELITPDSPTQRVGGKPREGFLKAPHSSPMLSLDNTYSEDELRNWERRVHELSGRDEHRVRLRTQARRHVPRPALRERHTGPRHHSRRRTHRRRRHAERADGPLHPAFHSAGQAEESRHSRRLSKSAAKCSCPSPPSKK